MRIVKWLLKAVLAVIVAIVLVGLVAAMAPRVMSQVVSTLNPFEAETTIRSGPTVVERIRDLKEFRAAEGGFSQDVEVDAGVENVPDFLAGENVVAIVTGTVPAVVDFGGLDDASVEVDENDKSIRLELPQPTLGEAEIDEESTRIIDRDRGLVNRLGDVFVENPTDDSAVFTEAKERISEAAIATNLIERARTNTENWMSIFLGAAGFEDVTVVWQE